MSTVRTRATRVQTPAPCRARPDGCAPKPCSWSARRPYCAGYATARAWRSRRGWRRNQSPPLRDSSKPSQCLSPGLIYLLYIICFKDQLPFFAAWANSVQLFPTLLASPSLRRGRRPAPRATPARRPRSPTRLQPVAASWPSASVPSCRRETRRSG